MKSMASPMESTILTEIMLSLYSVSQSASVASFAEGMNTLEAASHLTSTPFSLNRAPISGRKDAATLLFTSRVSAALHAAGY